MKPGVLYELYIGIACHTFVFLILGLFFMRPLYIYIPALLIGGVLAIFYVYSMYDTLDRALELKADKARGFATLRSLLRLFSCLAVMVAAVLIHWSAFVGVTVGLLGVKVSAFINPLVKKVLDRVRKHS